MAATKAAPSSPTKVSRKPGNPHRNRAGAGSSGPAPAAEPAVSELLFPTAELVLAEVMKSEQAEMASMAELVDDEVVESIADQMSDMLDDEVVAALSQHMTQDHLG